MTTPRTLFPLFLTVLIALAASSCSDPQSGTVDFLPVRLDGSEKWSLMAPDGTVVLHDEFEQAPTLAVNGYFSAMQPDGITVFSTSSYPSPLSGATALASAGVMTEGLIPVARKGSRIELLDENGNTRFTLSPVGGAEIDAVSPYFSSGRMVFHLAGSDSEGSFGAINTDGNVAVSPRFARLFPFSHNVALAALPDSTADEPTPGLRYMLVDADGKTLYTFRDGMAPLSLGVCCEIMPVSFENRIGFINKKGVFRAMPESVRRIVDFTDHLFVYSTADTRMGLMTTERDQILLPEYRNIVILDNDHFLITAADSTSSLIDRDKNVILSFPDAVDITSLRHIFPFTSEFKILARTALDTYNIYNDAGTKTNASPITDWNTSIILDPVTHGDLDMVRSDYFDTGAAVRALTGRLSLFGFGSARLGQPLQQLLPQDGDPADYSNTRSVVIDSETSSAFSFSATAYSPLPASKYQIIYDESPKTFFNLNISIPIIKGYEYRFDPDAIITRIDLELTTANPTFALSRQAVTEAIVAAGFTESQSTDAFSVFRSTAADPATLILLPAGQCCGTKLVLLAPSAANSYLSTLKRDAEINYSLGTRQ